MEQSKKLPFYPMYGVCILESIEKEDDLETLQTSFEPFGTSLSFAGQDRVSYVLNISAGDAGRYLKD
ncbi:hypothetical protein [Paenibacillus polymyxa]|uniref:hypothetical protein n=1 Tax=Paenibacillus polymyxa TaxID=1406 RepID=UPI002AB4C16D|nr:hypothetical protein [Paenibacillus polymyxa]MDY8025574.1 hypothetical protein [Paenibacillus polymyxa]